MSFWQNLKKRIIAFVLGIVFTVVGAYMIYDAFFGKKTNSYTDNSYYAYAFFFIGIALVLIAVERKKKGTDAPKDADTNTSSTTTNDQNTAP